MSTPTNSSPVALQTGSTSGHDSDSHELSTQGVYTTEVIRTLGPPWFQTLRNAHLDNWLINDDADDKKLQCSLPSHASTSFEVRTWITLFYKHEVPRERLKATIEKIEASIANVKWNGGELWSTIDENLVTPYLRDCGFQSDDAKILDLKIKKSLQTWEIFCYRFLLSSWKISNTKGLISTIIGICKFNAMFAAGFPKEKHWNWIWWIFVTAPCLLVPLLMKVLKWIGDGRPVEGEQKIAESDRRGFRWIVKRNTITTNATPPTETMRVTKENMAQRCWKILWDNVSCC